jgi:uncharacterized membrane protein
MDGWLEVLTVATALVCGLSAGVFFAFSSFVMQGLGRLEPAAGAAAMQAINVTAVTPPFMTVLFAPGLACLVLVVAGLTSLDESYAGWLIGGAVAYVVGTIGLTIVYHVPRNDRLAAVPPEQAQGVWARYLVEWTRANHVRAAAALAAATALTIAVVIA